MLQALFKLCELGRKVSRIFYVFVSLWLIFLHAFEKKVTIGGLCLMSLVFVSACILLAQEADAVTLSYTSGNSKPILQMLALLIRRNRDLIIL